MTTPGYSQPGNQTRTMAGFTGLPGSGLQQGVGQSQYMSSGLGVGSTTGLQAGMGANQPQAGQMGAVNNAAYRPAQPSMANWRANADGSAASAGYVNHASVTTLQVPGNAQDPFGPFI